MTSVLVVDDETIMREAFSRLFDWERYGLRSAGQAKNGKEALDLIRENDIDIVITDLKMPVMDGLTLIEEAQKIKPQLKFVVLSAYDHFDLVSQAFKLGVKDYFLKVNLDADQVLSVLSKLSKEIETERMRVQIQQEAQVIARSQREKLEKIEAIMSENEQILREQLLKKLLWNNHRDGAVLQQLAESGVILSAKNLRIMVLVLENYYEIEKNEWYGERELLKFGILNLIEEVLQNAGGAYGFCNVPNEYVLIYQEADGERERDFAQKLFISLQSHMERCFGFVLSAGLSDRRDGFESCIHMYQEARHAYEHNFLLGKGVLIMPEHIPGKRHAMNFFGKAEAFKKFLPNAREPEQLLGGIPVYRLDSREVSLEDEAKVRELFYLYYYEILEYLEKYNLSDRENLGVLTADFFKRLKDGGTLPELNKWLMMVFEALAKEMDQTGLASRAKRYINQHYSRDIALGDVAEHLNISESYLSRVFKKETGDSFSNYLLHVRIEAAVELMKNTNYKIYEIAEMVGYNNVEYFSRMFKKVTGRPPSAF